MNRPSATMPWVGGGIGGFYALFFLFFLVAHLMGDDAVGEQPLSGREIGMFVAIGVTMVGVGVSMWRPAVGGWLAVSGWVGLVALDWAVLFNPYFGMAAVAGVLLILGSRGAPGQASRE